MTAQHTPGPWDRHDTADYAEIHPTSGKLASAIALVGRPKDADLIAAAPDLLKALERMIYETTHLSPCKPNGDHDCTIKADALAAARAARVKALGAA